MMHSSILIQGILLGSLLCHASLFPYAVFPVETDQGYTMEINILHTLDESHPHTLCVSVEIINISGPYILICQISVDESIESLVTSPIVISEISSRMEEGTQVLSGTVSLSLSEQTELSVLPLYISGLYSGCEGGCESFLVGPLSYRLCEESPDPGIPLYAKIFLVLGCLIFFIVLYFKKIRDCHILS